MENLSLSAILLPKRFSSILKSVVAAGIILCLSIIASFGATIKSFLPTSGAPGTLVTVKGTGFTSATKLTIGGKPAVIISFTATQILGMVMPGAITGKVTVNISTNAATDFTVTQTPYPGIQQGAKLIDTVKRALGFYSPFVAQGQGASVVLSADGNSAIVNGSGSYTYPSYLFYARTNGIWAVSAAFGTSFRDPVYGNNLALSADGNTALIGENLQGSLPAKLYRRNKGVWAEAGTLNDSLGSVVGLSADGKTAILGKRVRGGSYGGGSHTATGITIMKLVGSTWQPQQVQDVPQKTETKVRYRPFNPADYDEDGNLINPPDYYTVSRSVPGSLVAISADGKTAAASSHANYGRYNYQFNLGYTVIYGLSSTGWKVQATLPESYSLTLSADGNTFLADGIVYIRNGKTWSQQQQLPYGGGAMSADGNTVIFTGDAPTAFTRTGNTWVQKQLTPPTSPAASFSAIALSADGTTAFFGAAADTTRTFTETYWGGENHIPLGSVTVYGVNPYNPLDYATAITFSNTTDKTTTLSWPKADGTANRAVFLKLGTAGLPAPVKGTAYAPDSVFTKGSLAGAGWYCVYNGKGGYVNITGLKTGTTYTASVVGYTGSAGAETYEVTGTTARVTTPIVAPEYGTNVFATFGKNEATTIDITYYPQGLAPVGYAIFVKDLGHNYPYPQSYPGIPAPGNASYGANAKFGAGEQIGDSGWFCVYNGAFPPSELSITNLHPANYYRITAVAYNGTKTNPVYTDAEFLQYSGTTWRTRAYDPPTGYATAYTFSNTTATSSTLSWTNGTGASRAVFIKVGSMGAPVPSDGYPYTASNPFTSGSPIYQDADNTDWYCVYTGTGSSVNLLGLLPSTTYRVAVVDYNGGDAVTFAAFVKRFNGANVTTLPAPGAPATPPIGYATALAFSNTAATSTTLSWVSGNGSARAVFLKLGTSGALNVTSGTTYTANNTFGLGTQAGTNGWYCVITVQVAR
jgi:hypothetical protein